MAQQNDNFVEGLKKLVPGIAQLALQPDADIEFLTQLQMVIRNKVMGAYMQAAQLAPGGAVGPVGPGGGAVAQDGSVPGMGLGPVPPTPMGPGGASGGGAGGIAPPNADELRRVLAAGGV